MAAIGADESVTQWIADLKDGGEEAAEQLWERYFHRLVALARGRLSAAPRQLADEEDVALSAFKSLCLGAAAGRFPQLHDRDNLWPLLVVLTARKACDLVKHERRQKRGGPRAAGETLRVETDLALLLSKEPTPEFSAIVAETCETLLTRLETDQQLIARRKLEGYTNGEIAAELDCGLRTVERRLELIRRCWDEAEEGG